MKEKQKPLTNRSHSGTRLWAILFAIAAVTIILSGIINVRTGTIVAHDFAHGVGVTGTVTNLQDNPSVSKGGSAADTKVEYSYITLDQQQETGSGFLSGPIEKGLRVGSSLTVIYNRDQPHQSILAANVPDANDKYGHIFLGVIFGVISTVLFGIELNRKTQK